MIGLLAAALVALTVARTVESSPKKKPKWTSVFHFSAPRWQVGLSGSYASYMDYYNIKRGGGGIGLFGLFRITRALCLFAEADYFYFEKDGGVPESHVDPSRTQAVKFKGLIRYDIDISEVHPYAAAGGSLYVFTAGFIKEKVDPFHWGPELELGIDWEIRSRVVLGFAFDYGWIVKYSPPPGNKYPTFMQIAIRVGSIL